MGSWAIRLRERAPGARLAKAFRGPRIDRAPHVVGGRPSTMSAPRAFPERYEDTIIVDAPVASVFAFVDDHSRFSSHMTSSSWRMAGSRMSVSTDDLHGQAIGSHIRMHGRVLGVRLALDEVVTRRTPPVEKEWETVGAPRLLVIGHYRMRLELEPRDTRTLLRASIDYERPPKDRWLGRAFGGMYAKWCVRQMLQGARDEYARGATARPDKRPAPRPAKGT